MKTKNEKRHEDLIIVESSMIPTHYSIKMHWLYTDRTPHTKIPFKNRKSNLK